MPRVARKQSSSDVYHVILRGSAQQLIFEDDRDRRHFLGVLTEKLKDFNVSVMAWCLMGNHVHLLLRASLDGLVDTMKIVGARYATYFNLRHGRCGHLFQGRFLSEPVEDDAYFLEVVRYIHRNPLKAGITRSLSYRWSSYHEYLEQPTLSDTELVLSMFDSLEEFIAFHHEDSDATNCLDLPERKPRMTDDDAVACAIDKFGGEGLGRIKALERTKRDAAIRELKEAGLGVRQIQRLTGVPLASVSKA